MQKLRHKFIYALRTTLSLFSWNARFMYNVYSSPHWISWQSQKRFSHWYWVTETRRNRQTDRQTDRRKDVVST